MVFEPRRQQHKGQIVEKEYQKQPSLRPQQHHYQQHHHQQHQQQQHQPPVLEYHIEQHWHGYVKANREHLYEFLSSSLNWSIAGMSIYMFTRRRL